MNKPDIDMAAINRIILETGYILPDFMKLLADVNSIAANKFQLSEQMELAKKYWRLAELAAEYADLWNQ